MNIRAKKKKGFTLIELLIVVAIITILASAAIVAINPGKHFTQTRNATRWNHMNSVANGVYAYVVDNQGTYPDCLYDVAGDPIVYNEGAGSPWGLIDLDDAVIGCNGLVPTYISTFPIGPQGADYVIGFSDADAGRIIIRSLADEAAAVMIVQ